MSSTTATIRNYEVCNLAFSLPYFFFASGLVDLLNRGIPCKPTKVVKILIMGPPRSSESFGGEFGCGDASEWKYKGYCGGYLGRMEKKMEGLTSQNIKTGMVAETMRS